MRTQQKRNLGKILATGLVAGLVGLVGCSKKEVSQSERKSFDELISIYEKNKELQSKIIDQCKERERNLKIQRNFFEAGMNYYEALSNGVTEEKLEGLRQVYKKRFYEWEAEHFTPEELKKMYQKGIIK